MLNREQNFGTLNPSMVKMLTSALPFVAMATAAPAFAQTADNTATITVPAGAIETSPGNNSATDSDTIIADLVATNDNATGINGLTGNSNVLNVLTGDTVNGSAATVGTGGNVTISLPTGSTVPSELTFDPATGQVGVNANTPAGTYSFDYQICEVANPSNCRTATATVTVVRDDADLVTAKTLTSGDSTPNEGDTVTFQIEVTNNGPADATNVTLDDDIPAGLTLTGNTPSVGSYDTASGVWTIGDLANGASATLTLTATVDAGQGGNTITNVTTAAAGDQPDPVTNTDDLEEAVTVGNGTDLVTIKTLASADNTPSEGDTVTFQIEVTNNGPTQATNVTLTDQLPAGLTLTGNTPSTGTSYDTGSGVWTIGTLANGASATLTLSGTVDAGQSGNVITNTTSAASGDQTDTDTSTDDLTEAVTVREIADLVTVKTLTSGDPEPAVGETVTFQIEVTNNGPDTATNVTLTDQLPSGLTATGNNGTVSAGTSYVAATGVWTIPSLASGASVTLTLEGTVDAGQEGQSIQNITTAATTPDQDDPGTTGDDLEETVDVDNAISATNDSATGINGVTGENAVLNVFTGDTVAGSTAGTGNATLSVASGSSVPSELTFNTTTGDVDVNPNTPAGTYSFEYQICEAGNATNCRTATATVTVAPSVDLAITKTNTPGVNGDIDQTNDTVTSGSTTTYTLTVTNNGPDSATGAVVRDTPGAGLTCPTTNVVTIAGSGVPAGSFTIANLTGAGITLGTLNNGESVTLTYSCQVN